MRRLTARAEQFPTATAVLVANARITYKDLLERCKSALPARLLREIREVSEAQSPGWPNQPPTVALEASTDLGTVVALHALLEANITALPLNPRLSEPEQARLVAMSRAVRLKLHDGVWDIAQTDPSGTDVEHAAAPSAHFQHVVAPSREVANTLSPPHPEPAYDGSSCAVLICTSGSTGAPKLVRLTRRALECSAAANAHHLGMSESDRWLLSLNPSHIGGYSILTRCLHSGSAVVLAEPRFSVEQLISMVQKHAITLLSLVPTQLVRLVIHPSLEGLSTLRAVLVGGAPCPPQLLTKARQLGIPALATFGLTEAASQVATQPLTERLVATEQFDSGFALPGTEVRIRDGIIEVRGGTLFSGYLTPDHTSAQGAGIDSDGWYRTGDLGKLTESGRLIVEGRLDDRIITGGEKVSPLELESRLLAFPGVEEVAVVGLPDAEWGQIVAAAVVPTDPSQLTETDWPKRLTDYVRLALASYKCPRRWLRLSELPRLDSGKLDRQKLFEYFTQTGTEGANCTRTCDGKVGVRADSE